MEGSELLRYLASASWSNSRPTSAAAGARSKLFGRIETDDGDSAIASEGPEGASAMGSEHVYRRNQAIPTRQGDHARWASRFWDRDPPKLDTMLAVTKSAQPYST